MGGSAEQRASLPARMVKKSRTAYQKSSRCSSDRALTAWQSVRPAATRSR